MAETWFIIVVSLCIALLLKSFLNLTLLASSSSSSSSKKLPPGPPSVPVIGSFLLFRKSFSELEPVLRRLRDQYGPIVTLRIGSRPAIFIGAHSTAHRALVQNGAIFSDRPKALPTSRLMSSNQHNISSAAYGPTWRLLRRNLTSEILHPSRVRSYSRARKWVLSILIHRLLDSGGAAVKVVDHFQYAMFCLLVLMCFGDKLNEKQINEIEAVQRDFLLGFNRFNILNFWPRLGKIVFRRRWNELIRIRRNQDRVLIPLIKARLEVVQQRRRKKKMPETDEDHDEQEKKTREDKEEEGVVAYVDTLVDLELPDEKRKLNDDDMVSLCSEFLNAGTDTTSTALQWIMANLVKYPHVQAKLYEEITAIVGPPPQLKTKELDAAIREDDLQRMPYLKAVVLEGLRRHPPGHFVLPHAVNEDVDLEGYMVPKSSTVNFMVAEMGWDPNVWEEPMEFKPERFLDGNGHGMNEGVDITGSREIKMMPFGAGRRICPGFGLALLHLELFVANLVWYLEWKAVDGDEVDLSEKQEFTVVMKNPLRAHVSPRVAVATAICS
ncbi:cytochrome P450 89A2-like [Diospyros lotus]|uniref:cytochrome P450 89A2-like n=1 Tax=Diospyros lotus TaxID=55363 RepID=UPI002250883E|nr:cytochrome P450 89A2-like [Diospyros lotus]